MYIESFRSKFQVNDIERPKISLISIENVMKQVSLTGDR